MSAAPSLGTYLRRSRERAGLSMEAVSAASRIVPRFVHALEADQHSDLSAPVYVRGFIRAYCAQVGADVEHAMGLYDAQAIADPPLTVQDATSPAAVTPVVRRWRRVAAVTLIVAGLGVAAALLLARRQTDPVASRAGTAPTSPEASDPRVGTASPTSPGVPAAVPAQAPEDGSAPRVTEMPVTPSASPDAPMTATPPSPVERVLLMRAVETTWVRIQPDGSSPAEETLQPGSVRESRSVKGFRVTAGNAGGILLELDGRPPPALGGRGQVIHATIPGEPRP